MSRIRCITTVLFLVGAATIIGCKSRQEAQAPPPASSTPNAGEVKSMSGQRSGGGQETSPQDLADAKAAAAQVLGRMEAGDFPAIYRDSEAGFKKIGNEAQFVSAFQQTRQKTGPLSNPQLVKFVTTPDKKVILIYRLQNDRFVTERRLTFARSKEGKMELFGLNQHDESKK